MAWSVFAHPISTAEATSTAFYQQFKFTGDNIIQRVARCWFVFYNAPVFDDMKLKLYTDVGGQPGLLLATSSNSWTIGDIYSSGVNPYAVAEIYFEFPYPSLRKNELYHAVVEIDGYTYSDSSHIAWKSTYPDPPYKDGLTLTYVNLQRYPMDLTFIGSKLK